MMPRNNPESVLITGAGGFIGNRLVHRLLADPRFDSTRFVLTDSHVNAIDDPRVSTVEADLTRPGAVDEILTTEPTLVFHLASVLSGTAETDYQLSKRVNVELPLRLIEGLREQRSNPRVVFASSVAVYGPPLPQFIDDDVAPRPLLNYGAQKLIVETLIEQFTARGWIDGLAVRLPGIVARRDADYRQRTAFFNTVFSAAESGSDFTLPVSAEGTAWLISVPAVIDDLVHAALLPTETIAARRAFNLPAQVVRMGDLVEQLHDEFPQSRGRITYEPQSDLDEQFARQPQLSTRIADELGFRHDGDLATLVRRALLD